MQRTLKKRDAQCLLALLAVQLGVMALVDPRGNFPINDDWAYMHSVQWLIAEGRIRLSDAIGMNLLPQTLAGGTVATLFGTSFEVLRHLTQVVSVIASFAAYGWFRINDIEPADALFASLAVIAFPAWPALANSYMTDLYGLALALGCAALFAKSLESPRPLWIAVGTCICILGILQRQVVAAVPFAFMIAWGWRSRRTGWKSLWIGVLPFVATLAAELAYQAYLRQGPGIPEMQQYFHGRVPTAILKTLTDDEGYRGWVGTNVATISAYLGWFLIGWALWWGYGKLKSRATVILILVIAGVAAAMIGTDFLPPFRDNQMVARMGIGPFTLFDGVPRWTAPFDESSGIFWTVAGIGAAAGIIALVALPVRMAMNRREAGAEISDRDVMSAMFLICYLAPFVVTDYIDRYLLYPLPFLIVLWSSAFPRMAVDSRVMPRIAAGTWIAIAIGIGALSTRDYFTWNRTRWDLIRLAESQGATPETLDGGFEYNGFTRHEAKPRMQLPGKSFWWVKDDLYTVAFAPRQGYDIVEARRPKTILARSPKVLYLLKRSQEGSGAFSK